MLLIINDLLFNIDILYDLWVLRSKRITFWEVYKNLGQSVMRLLKTSIENGVLMLLKVKMQTILGFDIYTAYKISSFIGLRISDA
jgi:hypothetical protein